MEWGSWHCARITWRSYSIWLRGRVFMGGTLAMWNIRFRHSY